MKNTFSLKTAAFIALCGVLAFLGAYAAPLLMILPALLALALLHGGALIGVLAFAAACLGAFLAASADVLYIVAIFAPAAALLAFFFKRKLPYRSALAAVGGTLAAARYLSYCLPSILAGQEAYAQIRELLEQITRAYVSMGQLVGVTLPESAPALIADMAPQMTMISAIAPALLFAFLNILFLRALCVKRGIELRPMARYYDWKLSKESLIGAGILTAGMIVVRLMSLTHAPAISTAIETILLCEFAFNGFCYTEHNAVKILRQPLGRRVLRYILYFFLMLYGISLVFLAIVGLADCIFSLRARFDKPPQRPEQ